MARRVSLSIEKQQSIIERLMDDLVGLPVQSAIDLLDLAKKQVLYLATFSKPEDDLARRQMKFEALPHSGSPFQKQKTRKLKAA